MLTFADDTIEINYVEGQDVKTNKLLADVSILAQRK